MVLLRLLSERVVRKESGEIYDSASDQDEEFRHCDSHDVGYGITVYQPNLCAITWSDYVLSMYSFEIRIKKIYWYEYRKVQDNKRIRF